MAATTPSPPAGAPVAAASAAAAAAAASWDGSGTQEDLMLRDQVILVDGADAVLGGASKFDAHRFEEGEGEGEGEGGARRRTRADGLLHRAFSVFLFDARGDRLLLQRRAACKITFPGVWTNTCCSHQLHGQDPPEVDDAALAAATGEAPGAAAAAVRKLWHELGVEPGAVPASAFKLVARLHYCARDEGNPESWGEHELDYVLLARVPTAAQAQQGSSSSSAAPSPSPSLPAFALRPNPEEVGEARWVTRGELGAMLRDPALRWSPWFRIIADKWLLPEWWSSSSSDGGDGGDGGGGRLDALLESSGEERAAGVREVHRVVV